MITHTCPSCGKSFRIPATAKGLFACTCGTSKQKKLPVCEHRGDKLGLLDCGCNGRPQLYECNLLGKSCCQSFNQSKLKAGVEVPKACCVCKFKSIGIAKWKDTEESIYQTQDFAIVTVAVGKQAHEVLDFTFPAMADYAMRCGADLYALINPTQNWWGLEKFRTHKYAQAYKKTLFLDCDVFVRRDAPSLFAAVPFDAVAIHDDWQLLRDRSFLTKDIAEYQKRSGLQASPHTCLNSGVVLVGQKYAHVWNPPEWEFETTHTMEQTIVEQNIRQRGYQICRLSNRWNCQYWQSNFSEAEPSSHFVHLANAPHKKRLELLRKLTSGERFLAYS